MLKYFIIFNSKEIELDSEHFIGEIKCMAEGFGYSKSQAIKDLHQYRQEARETGESKIYADGEARFLIKNI